MTEMPNSFDLMTNMHHTNPQLVEINNLTQQNSKLRSSNKMVKVIIKGALVLIAVGVISQLPRQRDDNPYILIEKNDPL
jgi:hypothetical protein